MNTYYLIADQTSNSGKEYISDDHSNTGDETSAKLFKTEEEAKAYITEQVGVIGRMLPQWKRRKIRDMKTSKRSKALASA